MLSLLLRSPRETTFCCYRTLPCPDALRFTRTRSAFGLAELDRVVRCRRGSNSRLQHLSPRRPMPRFANEVLHEAQREPGHDDNLLRCDCRAWHGLLLRNGDAQRGGERAEQYSVRGGTSRGADSA